MEFRIGNNFGDVIIEDEDLFGNDINIAARIQALAESGGIYISGAVFEQVKNKVSVVYEDLGEKRSRMLKNLFTYIDYELTGLTRRWFWLARMFQM
jgi:class 3 adenylate cyclase